MTGRHSVGFADQLPEWRSGWLAVVSAGTAVAVGPVFYLLVSSLFIGPLEREFNWQRGDVALLAAVPLVGALAAPLFGMMLDRFGYRRLAGASFVAVAIAYLGLSRSSGTITEAVGWMLLLGIAAPGATGLIFTRVVVSWFDKGRGTALGLMAAMVTMVTAALSPLFGWLIATEGFRAGYLGMAIMAAVVGLPAAVFFLRERSPPLVPDPPALDRAQTSWLALLVNPGFWLLALALLLSNIMTGGVVTQLAPLVAARGIDPTQAGFMLTLYLMANVAGRFGIGYAFDRFPPARVAALTALVAALGGAGFLSGMPQFTVYFAAIAVGIIHGAEVDIAGYFVSRLFPYALFGRALGAIQAVGTLGTAVGLVTVGQLYDAAGDYDIAIFAAMLLMLCCSISFLSLTTRMTAAAGGEPHGSSTDD